MLLQNNMHISTKHIPLAVSRHEGTMKTKLNQIMSIFCLSNHNNQATPFSLIILEIIL